jgi:hypothetical protein
MTDVPARRRIDRVTAPGFLAGLPERPVAELRAMRDDCREEEAHLSFARRVLQGRLDIVRAVVARRSGEDGQAGQGNLLEGLPQILADEPQGPTPVVDAHVVPVLDDPGTGGGRRSEDALVLDASLGRLPDLPDGELLSLVERLSAEERRVSDLRRRVLDALDTLQAELVRRYSADAATMTSAVDDAVSEAVSEAVTSVAIRRPPP